VNRNRKKLHSFEVLTQRRVSIQRLRISVSLCLHLHSPLDKFEFWFTFFLAVCMSTARERRVVFERVLYIYLIVTLIQTTVITHNIRIFWCYYRPCIDRSISAHQVIVSCPTKMSGENSIMATLLSGRTVSWVIELASLDGDMEPPAENKNASMNDFCWYFDM